VRPYIKDELRDKIESNRRFPPKLRKFFAKLKRESRRERRKIDRKALKDEWGF
jgi:hypothetical protein